VRVGTATIVRWARPAVVPVAAAGGLAAVGVATRHGEFTTFAGHSPLAATLQLAAGWALVAAGLVTWTRRPTWPAGPLAIVAGIAVTSMSIVVLKSYALRRARRADEQSGVPPLVVESV